jgi:hypothetical protein
VGGEGFEEMPDVARAALGGEPAADLIVVDDQADRILLVMREVGGRRGEFAGELELRHASRVFEVHRGRGIKDEMHAQAGFLLELLDVVALAAAEDLPIEMPQAVALDIVAVVSELDARALVHAGMPARTTALRRPARAENEVVEPPHRFGC